MLNPLVRFLERQALTRMKKLVRSLRFLSSGSSTLVESLSKALPPHIDISTNPYDLETHGKGESFHPTAPPSAVIFPTNLDDVVTIVRHCAQHKIPIIPYGAGTSVEGHVSALHGGISVDMTKIDSVKFEENETSLPDPIVRVGAGVTRKRLNEELRYEHRGVHSYVSILTCDANLPHSHVACIRSCRHTGMQFVVDPGADATIGGMVGA